MAELNLSYTILLTEKDLRELNKGKGICIAAKHRHSHEKIFIHLAIDGFIEENNGD